MVQLNRNLSLERWDCVVSEKSYDKNPLEHYDLKNKQKKWRMTKKGNQNISTSSSNFGNQHLART